MTSDTISKERGRLPVRAPPSHGSPDPRAMLGSRAPVGAGPETCGIPISMLKQIVVFLTALGFLGAISEAQVPGLYGIEPVTGNLYRISTVDASAVLLGPTGLTNIGALELGPNGFLYGMSLSGISNLYRIDPLAATATLVGPLNSGFIFEGGLAISPTGQAFVSNSGNANSASLVQLNLTTGQGMIGPLLSTTSGDLNGLGWRVDGMLIGLDRVTNSLLVIDPGSGVVTAQVPALGSLGPAGGIAIRGGLGYYVTSGAPANQLWTFDPFTGAQGLVGNLGPPIGIQGLYGLASDTGLFVDTETISLSQGGVQNFNLVAPAYPGLAYLVAGTTVGVTPGFSESGLVIPLNIDGANGYFFYSVLNPNTFPLGNTLGFLDSSGRASATFALPPNFFPSLAGVFLFHSFVVADIPGTGTILSVSPPAQLIFTP